jgi:hypothetical protein
MTETPMDRETAEEIKRHFNVVAESLRPEIRTVSDRLDDVHARVSAVFKPRKTAVSPFDLAT